MYSMSTVPGWLASSLRHTRCQLHITGTHRFVTNATETRYGGNAVHFRAPGCVLAKVAFRRVLRFACLAATLALCACGTPQAKDFRGSWKPVNRFQTMPTEIPLEQPYTFYAAPMDETLKNMLSRWAKDTGRTLSYQLSYDVTLYRPVARVHTADIGAAAAQLNDIYAPQGVLVIPRPRELVVLAAGITSTGATDNPTGAESSGAAHP